MQLGDLLLRRKNSEALAVVTKHETISYRQLYMHALELTAKLININGAAKKNVAILLDNSVEYIIAYFAIIFSGNIVVPIRPQLSAIEIQKAVEQCDIEVVLTNANGIEKIAQLLCRCSCLLLNVNEEQTKADVPPSITLNATNENDVAVMIRTSGTTSNPKTVMLTHQNLISNATSIITEMKISDKDRTLIILPLHFSSAHIQMITHFMAGGTLVLLEGLFLHSNLFRFLKEYEISNFSCVPYILQCLVERSPIGESYPALQHIGVGGTFVPAELLANAIKLFPHVTFFHYYGQTEASPRVTHLPLKKTVHHKGSIGKPIGGVEVKLVDEKNILCKPYEEGELLVHGKSVMKSYYKNDSETARVLQNGWLHTGDIAYADSDGYLYIRGRKKNIIICSGMNIYPEEVEEAILSYPGVKEVVVFGASDPLYQEVPEARIVVSVDEFSIDALRQQCQTVLALYKIPRAFHICSEISKTETGKVLRK